MREFAVVIFAVLCLSHAHGHSPQNIEFLSTIVSRPVRELFHCTQEIGAAKCLAALSVWRAGNAVEGIENGKTEFNLTADIEKFPWKRYSNSTNEYLYSQLCDRTEKLLYHRPMEFDMVPGYKFELGSNGDGVLNVNVLKKNETEGRKMKKYQKMFYRVVPFLLVPGLIMSAILPFVLPAMKMMTVAVGMLNNMALSGAIFTLLRNNAFNDRYEKKVVYVNAGYENEKHSPVYYKESHSVTHDDLDKEYKTADFHDSASENFEVIGNIPVNAEWLSQFYNDNRNREQINVKRNNIENKSDRKLIFRT